MSYNINQVVDNLMTIASIWPAQNHHIGYTINGLKLMHKKLFLSRSFLVTFLAGIFPIRLSN